MAPDAPSPEQQARIVRLGDAEKAMAALLHAAGDKSAAAAVTVVAAVAPGVSPAQARARRASSSLAPTRVVYEERD
jgi:hypothetical protein